MLCIFEIFIDALVMGINTYIPGYIAAIIFLHISHLGFGSHTFIKLFSQKSP